ncbi:MAG: hypothetical protein ABI812_11595 [Betaproteobacteria bacterium]
MRYWKERLPTPGYAHCPPAFLVLSLMMEILLTQATHRDIQ